MTDETDKPCTLIKDCYHIGSDVDADDLAGLLKYELRKGSKTVVNVTLFDVFVKSMRIPSVQERLRDQVVKASIHLWENGTSNGAAVSQVFEAVDEYMEYIGKGGTDGQT